MDPAVAAELFPHVRIVMGMVVGLGITRILMGLAGIIQHTKRPKLSLIHLLWAGSILLELVFFWWWEFELSGLRDWSFGVFFFLIFYAVTLFLLGTLLFPDKLEEYDGYEDFFLRRRHWFFGVFALTFALDIVDTLIKGQPYFDTLGIGYLIQVPIGIALCLIGIWTADRRYHLGLVLTISSTSWPGSPNSSPSASDRIGCRSRLGSRKTVLVLEQCRKRSARSPTCHPDMAGTSGTWPCCGTMSGASDAARSRWSTTISCWWISPRR